MASVHTIEVTAHGRYLVERPAGPPAGLLVGFHGYAETAEVQLDRLRSIPGSGRWVLLSIQGLHRFYRSRSESVVASWMTRQDRELAIADNNAFVAAVIGAVSGPERGPVVLAGFSQGVAMAFRAACASRNDVAGVVALGGDVPPELDRDKLARIAAALVGRGDHDAWYAAATWTADLARLRDAGVDANAFSFAGGHEWPGEFSEAAGVFLDRVR